MPSRQSRPVVKTASYMCVCLTRRPSKALGWMYLPDTTAHTSPPGQQQQGTSEMTTRPRFRMQHWCATHPPKDPRLPAATGVTRWLPAFCALMIEASSGDALWPHQEAQGEQLVELAPFSIWLRSHPRLPTSRPPCQSCRKTGLALLLLTLRPAAWACRGRRLPRSPAPASRPPS